MENTLYFRSKRDINGNYYYLIVDIENKRFCNDYNIRKVESDCIELSSKKALHNVETKLRECGFKPYIKL